VAKRAPASAVVATCLLASLAGCGGGSPLLHPARALPKGEVRATGGFSYAVAAGDLSSALAGAQAISNGPQELPPEPGSTPEYARGALVAAAAAPGLAPFAAARVGIGEGFEGGLAYTGRGARIDARKAFALTPRMDLSVGAGGSGAFYGRSPGASLRAVDLGYLRGGGFDVPVLLGWESEGGLYRVWGGARGGFEHAVVETPSTEPRDPAFSTPVTRLTADRWQVGGLAGVAAGFHPVHVALEVEVTYLTVSGVYNGTAGQVSGLSLTPAAALWVSF
jgi:hypothetical protein